MFILFVAAFLTALFGVFLGARALARRFLASRWGGRPRRIIGALSAARAQTEARVRTGPLGRARRAARGLWREGFSNAAFVGFFAFYVGTSIVWLLAGLLPAVAAFAPAVHEAFHDAGEGAGLAARVALNAAHASHSAEGVGQVLLDYLFSAVNLALGAFLIVRGPRHRAARLLALGMIGTAVAFNLQGHFARLVVPRAWLDSVEVWHNGTHVLSGVCYMLGLLLFPDGKLAARRRVPLLLFVGLTAGLLSPLTVEDHTTGLVVLFGILTPIAGVSAQVYRYRRAPTIEDRQRSRSLLLALALALGAASAIVGVTVWLTGTNPAFQQTTRDYEFTSPSSGRYVFVCDPHLEMVGAAVVDESADNRVVRLTAEDIAFDKNLIVFPPNEEVAISFTNKDADPHNVSIYRSLDFATGEPNPRNPVFIGELFSGNGLAALSFRVFRIVFIVIPIALFFGLIRFKLWDIDRFVNRTLVYTALAGFITAVYAGVVIGVGTLLGAQAELNVGLSIVVILLVAMAFQPLRQRAQSLANRLVYGPRATPYEVLARFSERAGETYDVEEVLPEMARIVGQGTGAKRAEVWLKVGSRLVRSASWPASEGPVEVPIADDGEAFDIEGADRVVAVRHHGELLGALAVLEPAGESLGPVEEKLLTDVAAQAGLLLRNTQLGAELRARLDELQASRQRIVAAQDAERRRIERDIHDGAQQHLVTLAMKLRQAQDLAEKDPERAQALLDELHGDTQDALQTVRDLARGIYPPILADRGLVVALQAQARRGPNPITVHADGVGRYHPEVEAAIYFCCLEAIQNAAKYAPGAAVRVQLAQEGDLLAFTIADEGGGFDTSATPFGSGLQNMADRAAALGGELRVDSARNQGTVVAGWVPARPHPEIAN